MHAVRRLREGWHELSVDGVLMWGTVAHGEARGQALARRKMLEQVSHG